MIFKTGNGIIQTGNGIISPTSGPLIKKLLLQDVSRFYQGIQNWFSTQEMELTKHKLELFIPFICLYLPLFALSALICPDLPLSAIIYPCLPLSSLFCLYLPLYQSVSTHTNPYQLRIICRLLLVFNHPPKMKMTKKWKWPQRWR